MLVGTWGFDGKQEGLAESETNDPPGGKTPSFTNSQKIVQSTGVGRQLCSQRKDCRSSAPRSSPGGYPGWRVSCWSVLSSSCRPASPALHSSSVPGL